MDTRWFWNEWPVAYRWVWKAALFIFISSLIYLFVAYIQGPEAVISWQKLQEQKELESVIHSFRSGPFTLDIPAENFIIFEYFHGSPVKPNMVAPYVFLIVVACAGILLLSTFTTLGRFWFFVAMALFILFLVSLRFEVLRLLGFSNQTVPIVILGLYLVPAFYFNVLNPTVSFLNRLATFLLVTVIVGVSIAMFSRVQYPFLHLSVTAFTPAIVLCVIFIFMIAHEVLAGFVYIISKGAGAMKSLRHFMVISIIYLANLLLALLHEMGSIQWDFLYVNLYLLFAISAVLGIWGFRQREPVYENIIRFRPFGAFVYIALASIAAIAITYFIATANDPALRVVRDAIIFSHMGYGILFMLYFFSNFITLFGDGIGVHKILYKPTRMPYFTFRLGGLIAVLAFFFYSGWREYVYHSMSAFYNNLGDLYVMMERPTIAEAYYEQGKSYGFQNNRSTYTLAARQSMRFDFEKAYQNYEYANERRPTPFSLVNEGNLYVWERRYFQAIEAYRKGLTKYRDDGRLQNNLGFAYSKIHLLDSALIVLNEAREHRQVKESAEANFLALIAQEYLPVSADSLVNSLEASGTAAIANAFALANTQGQYFHYAQTPSFASELNLYTATLLNNYLINNAKRADTTFLNRVYSVAIDPVNSDYGETLRVALAHAYYFSGNIARALQIMAELAFISQSYQGKYNYLMGLWALEQDNASMAASYFKFAVDRNYKDASLYYAIAMTENRSVDAVAAWDSVARGENTAHHSAASQLKRLLTHSVREVNALPEAERYLFARYRLGIADSLTVNAIVASMSDNNYRAQTLLDFAHKLLKVDRVEAAIRWYNRLRDIPVTNKNLFDAIQHTELRMLASRGEVGLLGLQINKVVNFEHSTTLERLLYKALISEANEDMEQASRDYEILANFNPYFEEGVIAAARFFKNNSNDTFKAYTTLAEAIQINATSIRLLNAYAAEAARMGFDDYAANAMQRARELEKNL